MVVAVEMGGTSPNSVIQTGLEGVGLSGAGLRRSDGQVPYGMGQNDNGSDAEIGMETVSRK